MFPLHTANLPTSASDLERRLNESLQPIFATESDPVTVSDHAYPRLYEIKVSLDGARLRPEPPRPQITSGKISSALEIDQLTISASPLSVGPAALDLSISATGVHLGQSKDSNEQIVLSLESASQGHITISMWQEKIEAVIRQLARDQAAKHGITIDGVKLTMRQENTHSLAVEIELGARKLFLGASLRVTGQLDLDDQLNLKIFGLKCTGDGGISTLACGVLKPYLEKFDGRVFPLLSLPLGEIRLRDVRLTVSDKICVSAEFGSEQAA